MKRAIWMLAALALVFGGVRQAKADMVLYDNGAVNGAIGAINISNYAVGNQFSVSDSFTLNSVSVLTGVQGIGLWVASGAPITVDWEIGTTPFAGDVADGTATLSNTSDGTNAYRL